MNKIENGTVVEVSPNHHGFKIPDGCEAIVDNVSQELGRFDFAIRSRTHNSHVYRGAFGKDMLNRPLKELLEVPADGNPSRVIWNHE